jgi:hypothetical protein
VRGKAPVVTALLCIALASCGGDDDEGDAELPLVDEIEAAVETLEEVLGDAPQYFEIQATPLAVMFWVSADEGRRAIPYVYADGEVADPGASARANGLTFAATTALVFDPESVLDQVSADLDDATLTQFSIVGADDGGVRLSVVAESARGGRLDIRLSPEGEPLEVTELG